MCVYVFLLLVRAKCFVSVAFRSLFGIDFAIFFIINGRLLMCVFFLTLAMFVFIKAITSMLLGNVILGSRYLMRVE